ncbi:HAD-IA family hydrolase [Kangiella sp. HZ709]|nr:HAD-IA family hydrolase [Kangiella sp. HZ709]
MDSTGRIVSAMQESARRLDLLVPTDEAVKGIIGLGLTECLNILFPELKCHKAITEEYRYQYVEADTTPTPVFEGVEEVLQTLKAKGHMLAVATGKARHGLDRVLDESGLRHYFEHTIGADEVGNAKPAPDMLNVLMQKTNTNAKEVIMIGDTSFDLEMANNAGTYSIGVTFGAQTKETLKNYEPAKIVHCFSNLKELF